jgi:hypothetical protein
MADNAATLEHLRTEVTRDLRTTRTVARRLRLFERIAIWLTIGLNLLVFVLGGSAAIDKQKLLASVPWPRLCGGLAVLSGVAALLMGLRDAFRISDKLRRAVDCSGRLKMIELEFLPAEPDLKWILQQYGAVRKEYEELLV